MELKMQVLELRQKVREAEAEVQVKIKELKQNAEQARMIKQQLDAQKAKAQREKSDWFNYGHEPLLKELLLVLDNLDRALGYAGAETDVKGLREGVDLIVRQLMGTLKKFGVEPIQALGGPFNPEFHQAMMQKEDAEAAPGTVVEEHQKGYMLKDRLLRPAMVTVSKRPAAAGPEKGPDED
jgi:molecular chaperone GrpE